LNKPEFTTSESIVLALDTSRKVTSLAVARGGVLLKSIGVRGDEKRSERLWSETESFLASESLGITDVNVFAVCRGPGGFTGLRVGIAAVKGLAVAMNRPVVGVTSLEAAAFSAGPAPYICSMVSAYKNEVYSQLFSFTDDDRKLGLPVPVNDPLVSSFEAALDRIAHLKEVILAGDGIALESEAADRAAQTVSAAGWAISRADHVVAEDIARVALIRSERGELQSADDLSACYVRPSEAEVKLSLGLLGSKIKRSMISK
jgi:tRNA threonylcarbamoyladenosine biosynthesis protein TsaB